MVKTMFTITYITLLCCNVVMSQINGEFWWLHEKVAQLQNIAPPQPKFEEISELETDESVKVIFQDDLDEDKGMDQLNVTKNLSSAIHFKDTSEFSVINDMNNVTMNNNSMMNQNNNLISDNSVESTTTINVAKPNTDDILNFIFPEERQIVFIDDNIQTTIPPKVDVNNETDEKISFSVRGNKIDESESICTFIHTKHCIKRSGIPYSFNGRPIMGQTLRDDQVVCCIMPLKTHDFSKIYFPDTMKHKRFKRSNSENPVLKQRNALMKRKYQSQTMAPKISSTTARSIATQRIVTPEDYLDPYWNVKNSKFRNPASPESVSGLTESSYDYSNQEYAEEVPQPGGLVGLYSDNNKKGWSLIKPNVGSSYYDSDDVGEEDDGEFFGYSTIDPRLGNKAMAGSRRKTSVLRPSSPSTSSSGIVSYRSKPDFQVLQGFKLLNLVQNKNRFVRKTTEPSVDNSSKRKRLPQAYNNMDYEDFIDTELDDQIYKNCGKSMNHFRDTEKEMDEAVKGSNPWMALVVLTRSRQSILCYATIVHPRAAVTAADCVHGTSAGELSLIAGIFDLSEDLKSQHRLVTVITHPQYKPGQLSNNLAVLHWKRGLIVGSSVQPVCMSDPHLGDDCYFIGWGGYDEEIRQRPRWQRATIMPPKACNVRLTKLDVEMPTDAFCATVDSPGSVTGVGGPLLCTNNNLHYIVGVAVWRDTVILTLPVLEWTARVIEEIVG